MCEREDGGVVTCNTGGLADFSIDTLEVWAYSEHELKSKKPGASGKRQQASAYRVVWFG